MNFQKFLAPILLLGLVLACSTNMPTYMVKFSGNTLQVPVTAFETSDMTIVRDNQAAYDILVVKKSPLAYDAFFLKCSYDDHPLTVTPGGVFCKEDGSMFDTDGAVKKGPAETSLTKFPTKVDDSLTDVNQGMITIDIQKLGI
jgi:hypothetical protein